jgi:hypothetical protein
MTGCSRICGIGISFVALTFASATGVLGETDAQLLSKIRSAWQERRETMKSFYFECAIESVEKIVRNKVDTFGQADPNDPPHDELLRSMLTFASHHGGLAYRLDGEQWNFITNGKSPSRFHAAFDGRGNRWLLQQGPTPYGEIDHLREPGDFLTNTGNLQALWLAIDAKAYLQCRGFETDKMAVLGLDAVRNGGKCIELDIPRGNADWQGRLCVDSAHGFLPTSFVLEYRGDVRQDLAMEHRHNDTSGWTLAGWTIKRFDRPGELHSTVNGAVMKCEVNTEVAPALFDVRFPAGTKVTEKIGKKDRHFIQMEDGSQTPIRQEVPGQLPKRT